jgi:protocatechuate 3,4-dioxygenase beta subunit/sugar lactone lactonase YvrE
MRVTKKRSQGKSLRNRRKLNFNFEPLEDRRLLAVVQPGFSESLYRGGLPIAPAALTIDSSTGNLFYADDGNTNGVLRKVAADASRTLTTITNDFTPPTASGLFPYFATDIQYHNGSVYTVISDGGTGRLVRINTASGQTSILQSFSGVSYETGLDVVATENSVYFTDGGGTANALFRYDLTSGVTTVVASNLPLNSYGLEINPADGKLYFARLGEGFFRVDELPGGGAFISQVSNALSGNGNFAIDPLGQYIFARVDGSINRVSLATGTVDVFATGLDTSNTRDLAFGPSSSGPGISLYTGNANSLLEYTGFQTTTPPQEPGEIHGAKWEDLDGDGVRDAGEPAMAGVVVYLDANRNSQLDAGETQATTDANGNYAFTDLQPGQYVVREVLAAGFRQTSPGAGQDFFYGWDRNQGALIKIDATTGNVTTIGPTNGVPLHGLVQTNAGELYGINGFNDALYRINPATGAATFVGATGVQLAFGLAYDAQEDVLYGLATPPNQGTGTVQLVKFNRANGQVTFVGAQPTLGLPSTSGITFDAVNRRVIAFDNSDDEIYAFNLQTGQGTRLSFARPAVDTYGLSQDGAGNLVFQVGIFLARMNPTTGLNAPYLPLSQFVGLESLELVDFEEFAHRVEVGSGAVVTGIDFGNQSILSTVSGNKWEDLDGDGVRDAGEPAMANVVVYLDANNDGVLNAGESQTTTGADGNYTFTDLFPGNYTVREVLPTNYRQTSPGVQRDYFWSFDNINRRIAKIDAITGAVTPIGAPGSIGINVSIHGLAYTNDGELYGISGQNGSLYRIDTTTGQATQIRGTGLALAWGLAYDAQTDTIYGLATPPGFPQGSVQPIIFNRESGGATFIGSQVTTGLSGTSGIAFDPVSRRLIAFDNFDDDLYSFDLSTGVGSFMGRPSIPLNAGGMADDGAGNVVLPTGAGLVKMNLMTRQVTPLSGPLANISIEGLEFVNRESFAYKLYVGPAQAVTGLDFGNQNVLGSISGTKWEDLDGDGVREAGEPAMANVVLYLDADRDGNLDAGEPQTTTDANGNYTFGQVLPGSYLVREVVPVNYRQTSPGVQRDFFWGFDWQNGRIIKIDAVTGAVTPIGDYRSIGTNQNMHGLVQTNDGQLFGISGSNGDNGLYRIDPTTGLATRIGSTGVILAWGLTYDPNTDTIYGAATPPGSPSGALQLITIDRTDASVTFIGNQATPNIYGTTGLAFDPVSEKVILYDRNSGRFFSFDPATGGSTLLSTRFFATSGLADDGTGQVIVQDGGFLVRYNPANGATVAFVALSPYVALDSLELIDFADFAHEVFVNPAQNVTGKDFGNQSILGDLSGQKFEDLDGDGVRDAGEPAMANVVVYLDMNNNGQLDSGESQTTTDAAGNYAFNDILPGSYVVREVIPYGYEQTSPGVQRDFLYAMDSFSRHVVKIDAVTGQVTPLSSFYSSMLLQGIVQTASGEVYGLGTDNVLYSVDPATGAPTRIGNSARPALARGLAYDAATDTLYGLIDAGAGRVNLVTFDRATGVTTNVGSATTQANWFGIGGLTFEPVTGEVWALDNNFGRYLAFDTATGASREVRSGPFFSAGGLASDGKGNLLVMTGTTLRRINPNTGETFSLLSTSQFVGIQAIELERFDDFGHQVYLAPSGSVTNLDFGNRSVVSTLSGTKFNDRNGDGVRQFDETGLGGVTVYLDLNGDQQLSPNEPSTVTAADGSYSFTNLLPGRYVVREVVPEGYIQSPLTELEDYFLGYDLSTNSLVTVDPTTGQVATKTPVLGNQFALNGLVRTNSNEIYAISGPNNTFYKVDPATGQVTQIGSAQHPIAWGLAYDAATDTIYGLAHPGNDLNVIALARYDRITGEAVIIGEPITGVRYTSGITFDPVRRKVLVFDNSDVREIYAFDPETGAGELLSVVTPPVSGFGLATDDAGYLILPIGSNTFARLDPMTGQWTPYLTLSRGISLESLEFIDFASGGHDVYLAPRSQYVGYDFGNQNIAPSDLQLSLADSIIEGSPVELTGSFTDPGSFESHTVEIVWGDGTVEQITLAPGVKTFAASHTYADDDPTGTASDPYSVQVRVIDSDDGSVTGEKVIRVENVAPQVDAISGPGAAVRGQTVAIGSAFTDPGSLDTQEASWDFGDGTVIPWGATAPGALATSHVYTASGVYTVTLTVRDDDGGISSQTFQVEVVAARLQQDPLAPGQQMLVVGGTTGNDKIRVVPSAGGQVEVFVNGASLGAYLPTSRIVVYGQDGDDHITTAGSLSAWLDGGSGNDVLESGSGNDVLLGGDGDDQLVGASGADLLVGGLGADRLVGSADGDILISGDLVDTPDEDLASIMATWNSSGSYEDRIAALSALLNEQTVSDDDDPDKLTGASGLDWYFAQLDGNDGLEMDKITDLHSNESAEDLEGILAE